jgi:hypothetical protein
MSDRHHPAEFAVSEIQILPPWNAAERGRELAHRASAIAASITHQRILRASGWHGRLRELPPLGISPGPSQNGVKAGVTIILQEPGVPAVRTISENRWATRRGVRDSSASRRIAVSP